MKKQKWVVAGFSGGKDSTAMVLGMIELGEQLDEVICCDTFKEFPAMYRHIEKVKKVIENAGIKFTLLRAEQTFDYLRGMIGRDFMRYSARKTEDVHECLVGVARYNRLKICEY